MRLRHDFEPFSASLQAVAMDFHGSRGTFARRDAAQQLFGASKLWQLDPCSAYPAVPATVFSIDSSGRSLVKAHWSPLWIIHTA